MPAQKTTHLPGHVWRLAAALLLALTGCIDSFDPQVVSVPADYLVVEGFINARGVSQIHLTRTYDLKTAAEAPAERGAQVYAEDEQGSRFTLAETAPGRYTSAAQTLDAARRYRLHFTTAAGEEHVSDYVAVRLTPEIDRINWRRGSGGLQLQLSTHDASNQTRYYRWHYTETWEYTSAYRSYYEYANGRVQQRTNDIYRCWRSANDTEIKIGNTTQLTDDVLSDYPLTLVRYDSGKLRIKYSILVQQYAQTAEEYQYWELLRRNTESIGTLFDPQPARLTGNVRSLREPERPVIGFVGAYSVTEKRLFIDFADLNNDPAYITNAGYQDCQLDTLDLSGVTQAFAAGFYIPIAAVAPNNNLIGYSYTTADCADCRRRGTNVRPSFWP